MAFMAQMDGAVSYCFWDMLKKKNTGLQGSTLSGPRMTTGFGPFELPTRGLLQKGRDHSPPKVCFEEPSFWLAHTVNALINAPLKNNYDPQRRLVWSEKNYFGPLGAPYLERRLRIRAQLTPFREVERAEYGYTDNDRI